MEESIYLELGGEFTVYVIVQFVGKYNRIK